MSKSTLEHANITVSDAKVTAQQLCKIFSWTVRWQGQSISGGYTYHIGDKDSYLAIYMRRDEAKRDGRPHDRIGRLNHVGIIVDDLEAVETRVKEAGFIPFNHGDYEPGRRFYFLDNDEIEFEVISYQ